MGRGGIGKGVGWGGVEVVGVVQWISSQLNYP